MTVFPIEILKELFPCDSGIKADIHSI
jgi:hypothetical protein